MSNIQFDNDPTFDRSIPISAPQAEGTVMTRKLVAWNFVKSVFEANILLIALTALFVFYAFGVWNYTHRGHVTTVNEVRQLEWMKRGNVGAPPASFLPTL